MLDALNLFLGDALALLGGLSPIAQVEAENWKSPLYAYRLQRAERLLDAHSLEKPDEET